MQIVHLHSFIYFLVGNDKTQYECPRCSLVLCFCTQSMFRMLSGPVFGSYSQPSVCLVFVVFVCILEKPDSSIAGLWNCTLHMNMDGTANRQPRLIERRQICQDVLSWPKATITGASGFDISNCHADNPCVEVKARHLHKKVERWLYLLWQ